MSVYSQVSPTSPAIKRGKQNEKETDLDSNRSLEMPLRMLSIPPIQLANKLKLVEAIEQEELGEPTSRGDPSRTPRSNTECSTRLTEEPTNENSLAVFVPGKTNSAQISSNGTYSVMTVAFCGTSFPN